MTINATAAWLLALYIVAAEEQGAASRAAAGHHPERHHQGVPRARHLRLPARPLDAADRRHDRLHGRARAQVEPDQHLLLPPAGGGRDARAGDRLRDEQRDRGARRGARAGGRPSALEQVFGRISFFVNAGVRFIEEHAKLRAMSILWEELGRKRYGVQRRAPPALPLRRAGQLAGADRGPAGEQRAADRAGDAGGNARARRPSAGDPAAGVERGAGAAAPVGPAMVTAHPAGARLRDRRPRVPRHLRGLARDGWPGRRAARGRARGDGGGGRARRRSARRSRT